MPTNVSSVFSSIAGFAANLQAIVNGMQQVANQIAPISLCVAFVLLVVGTMRGFMQNDLRHFFGNVLRVIILVALIGNWQLVSGTVTNAVNAFCDLQINANFGILSNNTSTTTTARLDLAGLAKIIQQKISASTGIPASTQAQNGQQGTPAQSTGFWQQVWNFFSNPVGSVQQAGQSVVQSQIISPLTHYLCQVLYAIFLIALLVSDLIVVLMEVLQQCIVVFLGLYMPVGFAEFSIPSLRGQAEAFFRTYVGVQCWPVGWVFVNIVTIALFNNLSAPNPEDVGQLLIAIVYSVPVFLWVVIGHILAPFYAQKLVTRGGSELQAFAGAMISAVGGTGASVYGGAFSFGRWGAGKINDFGKSMNRRYGRAGSGHRAWGDDGGQENGSGGGHGFGGEELLGNFVPGLHEMRGADAKVGDAVKGFAGSAVRVGFWGLGKAWDAGEFGVRAVGNTADTVGYLVADASGNRIGPERNFSFPRFGRNTSNRSSRRAAGYLNYQDSQN
jgi:hypothetical protein